MIFPVHRRFQVHQDHSRKSGKLQKAVKIVKDYENKMLEDDEESTQWECNNCSKMNPASFGICWNCQNEK